MMRELHSINRQRVVANVDEVVPQFAVTVIEFVNSLDAGISSRTMRANNCVIAAIGLMEVIINVSPIRAVVKEHAVIRPDGKSIEAVFYVAVNKSVAVQIFAGAGIPLKRDCITVIKASSGKCRLNRRINSDSTFRERTFVRIAIRACANDVNALRTVSDIALVEIVVGYT